MFCPHNYSFESSSLHNHQTFSKGQMKAAMQPLLTSNAAQWAATWRRQKLVGMNKYIKKQKHCCFSLTPLILEITEGFLWVCSLILFILQEEAVTNERKRIYCFNQHYSSKYCQSLFGKSKVSIMSQYEQQQGNRATKENTVKLQLNGL